MTELIIPLGYFCINCMIWSLLHGQPAPIEYICMYPTNIFSHNQLDETYKSSHLAIRYSYLVFDLCLPVGWEGVVVDTRFKCPTNPFDYSTDQHPDDSIHHGQTLFIPSRINHLPYLVGRLQCVWQNNVT